MLFFVVIVINIGIAAWSIDWIKSFFKNVLMVKRYMKIQKVKHIGHFEIEKHETFWQELNYVVYVQILPVELAYIASVTNIYTCLWCVL